MRRPIRLALFVLATAALGACASPTSPSIDTCTAAQKVMTPCPARDYVNPAGDYVNPAGDYVNPAGDYVNPAGNYVPPSN